jgi:hypothetical protein
MGCVELFQEAMGLSGKEGAISSADMSVIISITVKRAAGSFLPLYWKGSEIVCLNSIMQLTRQCEEKFQQGYKYLKSLASG